MIGNKTYKCSVCGNVDQWGPTWSRYSSIDLDETCPNDVPYACCDACAEVVGEKLLTGEWKLPRLSSSGWYRTVSHKHEGYKSQKTP